VLCCLRYLAKSAAHAVLALLLFAAPWRLLELAVAVCEPARRWPARQLGRAVATLDHTDAALALYARSLSLSLL